MIRRSVVVAGLLTACTQDVDPAWQLDHDRLIAVRATPNRIVAGEIARIDALVGRSDASPIEVEPDSAEVISPTRLAAALRQSGSQWTVAAPEDAELAAARDELGLAADAPVPLRLRVRIAPHGLIGLKIIWLGEQADNPIIGPVRINGVDRSSATSLTVARDVDVRLAVDFDDTFNINWLTSCGTMHDFDLASAYLRVEPNDPTAGTLGVVVRDAAGGVAWQLWPIAAQ